MGERLLRYYRERMKREHKMAEKRNAILFPKTSVAEIVSVFFMGLTFLFGSGIAMTDDAIPAMEITVEMCQSPFQNNEVALSGYEAFTTYKGMYFSQDDKVYKYSGAYTGVSDDSSCTRTYYKYFYVMQA